MNLVGVFFVVYFFGYFVGLIEGDFLLKMLVIVGVKINDFFWVVFVFGIGCNWFVGIVVWFCYVVKDFVGKIFGIWFLVMVFVVIGF